MFGDVRLGTRLFISQGLVLVGSVLTAAVVASIIGPMLFHTHLAASGEALSQSAIGHIEEAYTSASAISLGVGFLVAVVLAIAVTWFSTNRLRRPLREMTSAAQRVSGGEFGVQVAVGGAGPELATLGEAFNQMSGRLGNIEDTRRRLLSDLAHELRTPTATIQAHLEGLADGVIHWDAATQQVLAHQVERLTRLARDLDEVSRADEGRMTIDPHQVRLVKVVELACRQWQPAFDTAGVTLAWQVVPVEVVVDPLRISQLLTNLLGNALRHTPTGGHVTVTGELDADDSVVVVVQDDGEGMAAEQLEHAFERFYRGDSARATDAAGSGIGLTIARSVARAHNGTLTATSPGPGEGATFTLTLPRVTARKPTQSQQVGH